jgi:S1-C subfamily serine protease
MSDTTGAWPEVPAPGRGDIPPPPDDDLPLAPYVHPAAWGEAAFPAPEAPAPPGGPRPWRYAVVGAVAGILGAAITAGAFLLWSPDTPSTTVVQQVENHIISTAQGGTTTAAEVAQAVLPSIVTVQVRASTVGDFVADVSGSGVVLRSDGLLVTNDHVVQGAGQVRVIFAGGHTYPAEVVGEDAVTDLAVLRIAATGLIAITLGSSEDMAIGDTAIAVGSPLGLEGGPSVTVGVISAFGRQVRTGVDEVLYGMLQTDAPITRGSSGGALVDSSGRLIGITSAIGVSDVGAEGLGFAIPVELVDIVTEQLITDGVASHPFMGISGTTFVQDEPDGSTLPAGVVVAGVTAGTAAEQAGIQVGDVILSVGGESINTMDQLVVALRFYRVGEVVDVEIQRGGERQTLAVTLMERPEGV